MGREYAKMGIPVWCELWMDTHNDAMHNYPREECEECQKMIRIHGAMPPRYRMIAAYASLVRPERKSVISTRLRRQVFDRDGHRCRQCGATEKLCADHIIAEIKGGPTTLENLQTLCRSCNSRKADK